MFYTATNAHLTRPRRIKNRESTQTTSLSLTLSLASSAAASIITVLKRIIRNRATRAFLAEDGSWTKDLSRAQVFPNMEALVQEAQERALKDVELMLVMGETLSKDYDIIMPLRPPPPA